MSRFEHGLGRPLIPSTGFTSPIAAPGGLADHVRPMVGTRCTPPPNQRSGGIFYHPLRMGLRAIQPWPCHAGLAARSLGWLQLPAAFDLSRLLPPLRPFGLQ